MKTDSKETITVEATINASDEKVWEYWTEPEHITKWSFASNDWQVPLAENDLRVGGTFLTRMEAKDGSFGFDFGGVYSEIKINELISYTLGDGRKVIVTFISQERDTKVREVFEAESTHSNEQQKAGWQALLDKFKEYSELSHENENLKGGY
ncbi:SRPBCC family protein [Viridibacillus arvi]|uniref:SRPBCC family protein n=1 Tax=Viridibacillus arvi TaxID=263475 RepID=UPI00382C2585